MFQMKGLIPGGLFGTPADSRFETWQGLSFVLLLSTSSLNYNSILKNHTVGMKEGMNNW